MKLRHLLSSLLAILLVAGSAKAIDVVPGLGGATITTSGSGVGQGTTAGTSTTGFGKEWFPGNYQRSAATGQQGAALFTDDLNVVILARNTGCGNCLQINQSSDGGINFTTFSTSLIIGQTVGGAFTVPTSPPRYLVWSIDGGGAGVDAFQSASLLSGWTGITGINGGVINNPPTFASKPDGSRVLSLQGINGGGGAVVGRSTDGGISFGSFTTYGTNNPSAIQYAGGTTWLFNLPTAPAQVWRSTDDGVSFALLTTVGAGNGTSMVCLSPSYTTCLQGNTDGNIYLSTNQGATWTTSFSGTGAPSVGMCDYGGGVVGALTPTPPVGLATISQNAWTTLNAGLSWFAGHTNGSPWDGTGAPNLRSFACRNGRGVGTYDTTGGGVNVFNVYNPLTAPGGTLTSSAGGYQVAAPIQSGIILNAAPTTSAANTAAVVTLTNISGSRICVRSITLFSSAAGAVTLTVSDGATVVRNFGTLVTGTSAAATTFEGVPLLCSQTNNNIVVNIGAAGAAVTTTTSVIADRYPN